MKLSIAEEDTSVPVKAVVEDTGDVEDLKVKNPIKTPKRRKVKEKWVIL